MRRILYILALIAPTAALAHTGIGAHGAPFASGLAHPLLGADHLLAMLAVGLLASLQGMRLLEAVLFEVSATDAPTIAAAAVLLLVVAAAACWLPGRRAASIQPAEALAAD